MQKDDQSLKNTKYLRDYEAPNYLVTDASLIFDIVNEEQVNVKTKLSCEYNYELKEGVTPFPIELDGEELLLKSIKINGEDVSIEHNNDKIAILDHKLIIQSVPLEKTFSIEIENEINPLKNKAFEGLYVSGNILCTQNEAEGFRRITYFFDRPDVMAKYTTKIIADRKKYPVLLSNGSLMEKGNLDDGKHWVSWVDSHPKPTYLYALVAGDLEVVCDKFNTKSNRNVELRIYCDKGNGPRCKYAMESVKKAMKWDEDRFGLEYDLDIFMIVAVDSFNAGAMENKGLNIFNSKYILADPQTATDEIFYKIEAIIGHEYFHNYTGNRITCRDWFQLTLKEGLTVFRDRLFSAEMNSSLVERVNSVRQLKKTQFAEDSGPTAHPIRPDSYMEIDNFYTTTVYLKGAEVIRMAYVLLGEEGFRKGIDKYFELFDGQAVTVEDFLHALSLGNSDYDFTQFLNWYKYAGTPLINVEFEYKQEENKFIISIAQTCPETPGQKIKPPFYFPLKIGLLGSDGKDIPLKLEEAKENSQNQIEQGIIHISKEKEDFVFTDVLIKPLASLNREFSAPIKVNAPYSFEERISLLKNDSDGFNRYEAGQNLAEKIILELVASYQQNKKCNESEIHGGYIDAFGSMLNDLNIDDAFKSLCLKLPDLSVLFQKLTPIDHGAILTCRDLLKKTLATNHKDKLLDKYLQLKKSTEECGEYKLDTASVGARSLKNTILDLLMKLDLKDNLYDEIRLLARDQYLNATNLTDELAAFTALAHSKVIEKDSSIEEFFNKWNHEPLVIQKWFSVQASSPLPGTLGRVKELMNHPSFDITIPNFVSSLIGDFVRNPYHFHQSGGEGYKFIADQVIRLDSINPSVASGITSGAFSNLKKLLPNNQELMKSELERIKENVNLSKNVYEIVFKILYM